MLACLGSGEEGGEGAVATQGVHQAGRVPHAAPPQASRQTGEWGDGESPPSDSGTVTSTVTKNQSRQAIDKKCRRTKGQRPRLADTF